MSAQEHNRVVVLRLPAAVVARIDALRRTLTLDGPPWLTRSDVARAALDAGLKARLPNMRPARSLAGVRRTRPRRGH